MDLSRHVVRVLRPGNYFSLPPIGCQTVPRGRRHCQFEILWYRQKENSELCPCPEKNDNTTGPVGEAEVTVADVNSIVAELGSNLAYIPC